MKGQQLRGAKKQNPLPIGVRGRMSRSLEFELTPPLTSAAGKRGIVQYWAERVVRSASEKHGSAAMGASFMTRSSSQKPSFDLIGENAWWIVLIGHPAAGALLGHLAKWSPGELVGLVAVLFAASLRKSAVSASVIEQVFTAVRRTEPPMRQAICYAIRGLTDGFSIDNENKTLATLRCLCESASPPADEAASPIGDRRVKETIVAVRAEPGAAADRPRD
jgi:hypothetical protein